MYTTRKQSWLDKFFDKEKKILIPQGLSIAIPPAQSVQSTQRSTLTPLLTDLCINVPSPLSPKRVYDVQEVCYPSMSVQHLNLFRNI